MTNSVIFRSLRGGTMKDIDLSGAFARASISKVAIWRILCDIGSPWAIVLRAIRSFWVICRILNFSTSYRCLTWFHIRHLLQVFPTVHPTLLLSIEGHIFSFTNLTHPAIPPSRRNGVVKKFLALSHKSQPIFFGRDVSCEPACGG